LEVDAMPLQIGDMTVYAIEDLCEMLGLQARTIRQMLRDGKLTGRKLGKRWYVAEDNLKAFFLQPESYSDGEEDGDEEDSE